MKSIKTGLVSNRAAEVLLEELLKLEDGECLGYESDLSQRLGISTPTLRQATKLLEYQQLLTIKRGRGGGYYARKPTTEGVVHLAAIVLRANQASSLQTLNTLRMLSFETTRIACSSRNAAAREKLLAMSQPLEELPDMDEFLQGELAFDHHLASMSEDPVLCLFSDIELAFSKVQREVKIFRLPGRRKKFLVLRAELSEAIIRRDTEAAASVNHRRFMLLERWIKADTKTA